MRCSLLVLVCLFLIESDMLHAGSTTAQERVKSDFLLRISQFIHHYDDKQMFAKWISLGNTAKFRTCINNKKIAINVDANIASCAQYNPGNGVLSIQKPPNTFTFSTLTSGNSSLLLWHEAVHAISHGHQAGEIKPSRPFKAAPKSTAKMGSKGSLLTSTHQKYTASVVEAVDHLYLNWAESCLEGTHYLVQLEEKLKLNGKSKPPDDVKAYTQRRWKKFVELTNASIFGQVPDEKERKEFEVMTGFRCDPAEILAGYLALGYPMEYFGDYITDEQVWKLFPTAEQLGTTGMKVSRNVIPSENISRSYSLGYNSGMPGRHLNIHLTLYGSPILSKMIWDARNKMPGKQKRKAIANLGEDAYLIDSGPKNSYRLIARFWNTHVYMTDLNFRGSMKEKGITVQRRALRTQMIKRLFKNIEELNSPPIPPGVITAVPKN